MNKKKSTIDYSSDNIFEASKQVASMSLKNVQLPPMIQQPDVVNPVQPIPNNAVLQPTPNNPVSEFMKQLKGLSNNLDATLTDLDALWNEVPYPRINLQNKQNHNPRFEQTYEGQNYGNNKVGEGLTGGALDNATMQSMTRNDLYRYCTTNNIPVPNGYQRTTKVQLMNLIADASASEEPDEEAISIDSSIPRNYNNDDESIDHWMNDEDEGDLDVTSFDPEYGDAYDDESDVTNQSNPMNDSANSTNTMVDENDTIGEPQDVYEKLMTGDLMEVANRISNLQIQFSSYVKPIFNTLQQDKVDEIKSELNGIKPKIEELVQDEFCAVYHVPQCTVIKNSFDKLYSSVIVKVNSWVKPLVNRGGNLDTNALHNNWRYYM
jgi:hypothetical protein